MTTSEKEIDFTYSKVINIKPSNEEDKVIKKNVILFF